VSGTPAKPISVGAKKPAKVTCSECSLGKVCVPAGLNREDLQQFEQLVHKSRPLHSGEHVFRQGDPFTSVAAVRSGCFKSYVIDEDGTERVLGFHLPGELLGLDAIYPKKHVCDVIALDTSGVCNLSYDEVTALSADVPDLQSQLFSTMSQRIGDLNTIAGDYTADQRLSAFLLTLSLRFQARGYSAKAFNLAMSRSDIANYLRLATETVSRVLARFQKKGLIRVKRKLVEILDHEGLHEVAGSAFCDTNNRT
jgi:CRP/FNR family transcriptional regulator